ncbi:MAG: transglutaminase family protein [Tepidibacillus sp.]
MKKGMKVLVLTFVFVVFFTNLTFASTLNSYILKVDYKYVVENTSGDMLYTVVEPILPNVMNSDYFIIFDEEGFPSFTKTVTDEKGNRISRFTSSSVTGNKRIVFQYDYLVKVSEVDYQLQPDKTKPLTSYDDSFNVYLTPSYHIESNDPFIKQLATSLLSKLPESQRTNPYYIAKTFYEYVQKTMYYTYDSDFMNKGALFAAKYHVGNCEDYSSLFVALLRASGVPARTVTGFMIEPDQINQGIMELVSENNYTRHEWAEAYINGYGWVAFEVTISSDDLTSYEVNIDGKPSIIEAYKPLTSYNGVGFGRLEGLYIKERYDFAEGMDLVSTSTPNANYYQQYVAQIVDITKFSIVPYKSIVKSKAKKPNIISVPVPMNRLKH